MYNRIAHSVGEYQETNPHATNAELLTGVQTRKTDSVRNHLHRYEISVCHRSEFSRMDSVDIGFEGRAKGKGRRVSESPHWSKGQVESFWEEIWIIGIYLLRYWTTRRPEAAWRSNSTSNSHTAYSVLSLLTYQSRANLFDTSGSDKFVLDVLSLGGR